MQTEFTLSCCSTVDLQYAYLEQRGIPILFYTYTVDDVEYVDDMGRDPEALPRFYRMLSAGKQPKTAGLSIGAYAEFFERQLQHGDLLHVAFTSGQSGSVFNAQAAAELVREKYPQRRLVVVDSLCSSSGYGMLVDSAADLRDRGCSLEETERWLLENRKTVHHQFFSTDLSHYRRSGRISGAAAAVGAILNLCPIMRLNDAGRIIAYDKVRGKRRAIERTLDVMAQHARGGTQYDGKCFICHSDCLEDAERLRDGVEARFPGLAGRVRLCDIGTIIASHCGPGTVAVFFYGDERPTMEADASK